MEEQLRPKQTVGGSSPSRGTVRRTSLGFALAVVGLTLLGVISVFVGFGLSRVASDHCRETQPPASAADVESALLSSGVTAFPVGFTCEWRETSGGVISHADVNWELTSGAGLGFALATGGLALTLWSSRGGSRHRPRR
jgi:hypothetical protein